MMSLPYMPRVDQNAEVTLVVLVYRSLRWLDWCMAGVDATQNETRYRWLVVANDATAEVRADPRIGIDFRNDDPGEFYINRVYRAWNEGIVMAPTEMVCMISNDMYATDYWLDSLVDAKRTQPNCIPTSLLVESGIIPSAIPEHARNFGTTPENFNVAGFKQYADEIRRPGAVTEGRLFGPTFFIRQEFIDAGMYPEGNPDGISGDRFLVRKKFSEMGFKHIMAMGSVLYHTQHGEQEWP
jgi:hypothetical protein